VKRSAALLPRSASVGARQRPSGDTCTARSCATTVACRRHAFAVVPGAGAARITVAFPVVRGTERGRQVLRIAAVGSASLAGPSGDVQLYARLGHPRICRHHVCPAERNLAAGECGPPAAHALGFA
jgi:hypothetical protein